MVFILSFYRIEADFQVGMQKFYTIFDKNLYPYIY